MRKEIINIEEKNIDDLLDESTKVLENGGVILTPTDTVYGVLCIPTNKDGVDKIYALKERPRNKFLPIIVSSIEQLKELPIEWNEAAEKLANKYWPGSLTLAFKVKENNIEWLEGRNEIAVRIPNSEYIIKLAEKMGPLLMTSANKSGEQTKHTVEEAMISLAGTPDLSIDGGTLDGAPSTIVNLNLEVPKVEREGTISIKEIEETLNK